MDFLYFVLVCLIAGLFSGLTSGLMGLGGGLVVVPVLSFVLPWMYPDLSVAYVLPIAIQTSFALVFFNTLTSSYHQYKLGNVHFPYLGLMGPLAFLSVLLTGLFVTQIAPGYLKIFFGAVVIYLSLKMLFGKKGQSHETMQDWPKIPASKAVPTSIAVGAISATAGISGGAFLGPFFLSCRLPINRALGNSSACGVFLALGGFISYFVSGYHIDTGIPYSIGYFSFVAFFAFLVTSLLAASYGVKLQNVLPAAKVKKCFAIFILVVAIDMIISGYQLLV